MFFNSPSDVAEKHIAPGTRLRLGGLVKAGSLVRGDDLKIRFDVTDGNREIAVAYRACCPICFGKGRASSPKARWTVPALFTADTILAKHDETYMPKEVADALKKSGHWKDDYGRAGGDAGGRSGQVIAELGHYALMLALGLALIQATMPIVGARSDDPTLLSVAAPAALAQFVFVALSFGALAACYVTSDFSVLNVYENSNSAMPLMYRLTSVWGNHEGSMMLWVFILALFGALVAAFGGNLPAKLKANALAVQAWIAAAFQLFILTTSNPFLRIADAPFEGRDLNPILQDPGLAFHPPLLYLGYVGFSIAFSFAIAALLEGRIDAAWARWVRPWVLGCLDVPDARHRRRFVLGLLRARLGRLLVLGSGRKRFADAVARRHRAVAFRRGDGEARRAQGLDDPAGDPRLLAVVDRHFPGAIGRAHLGARLRHRSAARNFHSRHPRRLHRRRAGALRVARAAAQAGRPVRADLARRRAGPQQSVSDLRLRDGFRRHALSARA